MKRKERAHLKEDPFRQFIETILHWITRSRRELVAGVIVLVSILVVILAVTLVRSHSYSRENRRYSEALSIRNSETLSAKEKIDRLSQLKSGRGLSSAAQLFLAGLYFEQDKLEEARELMDNFSSSHLDIINDQKLLLEAQILGASEREREALDLLNQLLADSGSEVAKDYVLLLMAQFQFKARQLDSARDTLERLLEEFPLSAFTSRARQLKLDIEME